MRLIGWLKVSWIGIVAGVLLFPAMSLGGTYTASLIQGKTVEEANSILADQIDSLVGRVKKLETSVEQQEKINSQQETINQLQVQLNEAQTLTNATSQQDVSILNETIQTQNATITQQQATIKSLQNSQTALQTSQSEQAHQIECDRLKWETLSWGNVALVNTDVVKWYEEVKEEEDQWRLSGKTDEELAKAKSLYDTYIATCGR